MLSATARLSARYFSHYNKRKVKHMRVLAATAIIMVLGLVPYLVRNRKPNVMLGTIEVWPDLHEEELRYDINDFYGTGTEIE